MSIPFFKKVKVPNQPVYLVGPLGNPLRLGHMVCREKRNLSGAIPCIPMNTC